MSWRIWLGVAAVGVAIAAVVFLHVTRHQAAVTRVNALNNNIAAVDARMADADQVMEDLFESRASGSAAGSSRHDRSVAGADPSELLGYASTEKDAVDKAIAQKDSAQTAYDASFDAIDRALGSGATGAVRAEERLWNQDESDSLDSWDRAIGSIYDSVHARVNGSFEFGDGSDVEHFYSDSEREENRAQKDLDALDLDVKALRARIHSQLAQAKSAALAFL